MAKDGSFFMELGVKADTLTVKEFAKSIADLPLSTAAAIASIAGLDFSIVSLTNTVLDMGVGFNMFNASTGQGIGNMQQWAHVLESVGGKAEDAENSLSGIQNALSKTKWFSDPTAALGYQFLKINDYFGKNPSQLLMEMREKYQALGPHGDYAHFQQGLGMVGISNPVAMMSAFKEPAGMFNTAFNTPTLGNGQVDRLMQLKAAIEGLTQNFLQSYALLLDKELPAVIEIFKNLTQALKEATPVFLQLAVALSKIAKFGGDSLRDLPISKKGGINLATDLLGIGLAINKNTGLANFVSGFSNNFGHNQQPVGVGATDNRLSFIQHNYGMPGTAEDAHKHATNEFIRASKLLNRQGY